MTTPIMVRVVRSQLPRSERNALVRFSPKVLIPALTIADFSRKENRSRGANRATARKHDSQWFNIAAFGCRELMGTWAATS